MSAFICDSKRRVVLRGAGISVAIRKKKFFPKAAFTNDNPYYIVDSKDFVKHDQGKRLFAEK